MTRETDSPRTTSEAWTFAKPARPPGLRLFNWLGAGARRLGWRHRLDADEILEKVRRRTGLVDWGDEYFLEPLRILVQSLEQEAALNSFGRVMLRGMLSTCVGNRLRVRDYLRQHPDARETAAAGPLIVVGMPRTGTTLLYNLLAQDPAARPLLGWESLWPAPWPSDPQRRERLARAAQKGLGRLAPELQHIHPFHVDEPEECTWLMTNTLVSPAFPMFGHVPSYEEWLWGLKPADWTKPYEDYLAQLQVLQHQRAGHHWVLKSPVHFMSLDPLLATVPGARVVLTDRDPREVVPSACSLFAVLRGIGSDSVDRRSLGRDMVEHLSQGLRRAEAVRADNPERVLKVQFRDLVKDQVGTVQRIYAHFGLAFEPQVESAIRHWIANTPHCASHKYGLEQFGLTEAIVAERFAGLGQD